MFEIKGKLEFIYNNERKQVDYSFCNLGGTPMFSFDDQRGKHHQFIKVFGNWESRILKQPKWPKDFLTVLYKAFDQEFKVIYKNNVGWLYGINGIEPNMR